MNKVVREHYPASKLPPELRGTIMPSASVRVVVEEEEESVRDPLTRDQLLTSMREARATKNGVTIEEAVTRIRTLRDEWKD